MRVISNLMFRILFGVAVLSAVAIVAIIYIQAGDGLDSTSEPSAAPSIVPGVFTYTNVGHKYTIDYPDDWRVTDGPTICDPEEKDFCVQETTLTLAGAAEVYIFVNFQGGWCEGVPKQEEKEIVVSGQLGTEYRCHGFTIRSFPGDFSVIRSFPDVEGVHYFVIGQATDSLSTVLPVVESFRFIE